MSVLLQVKEMALHLLNKVVQKAVLLQVVQKVVLQETHQTAFLMAQVMLVLLRAI